MMKSFRKTSRKPPRPKSGIRPPTVPLPAPPPEAVVKAVEEEFPEEDLASNREHFERVIAAKVDKVFDMYCSYVWRENAGVGGDSIVQITKDNKSKVGLEEGMERTVYGFTEVVIKVVKPRVVEYKVQDMGSFHKSRILFRAEPEDKTRVVWTIWWTPESMVSSMMYTMAMKGFCNLALYRLEQQILTGNVEKVEAEDAEGGDDGEGDDGTLDHATSQSLIGSQASAADLAASTGLKEGEVPKLQWAARLQTGYEGNLTPDQQAALDELRSQLKRDDPETWKLCEEHPDGPDRIMLRFLRAECTGKRKFNVAPSRKRLAETLKFRKDMNTEELLVKDPPKYAEFTTSGGELVVPDREGRIAIFTRAGLLSVCLDTKIMTEDEWKRNLVCVSERRLQILRENSKRLGHEVSATVIVYDIRGAGFASRKIIPFTKIINEVASKHYPEMVDVIFVVNAPGIFATLFAAIKSFLDPVTASKVCVFGTSKHDREKMAKSLRAIMDPKLLPREYGGESDVVVGYPSHYKGPKFPADGGFGGASSGE